MLLLLSCLHTAVANKYVAGQKGKKNYIPILIPIGLFRKLENKGINGNFPQTYKKHLQQHKGVQ